MSKGRVALDDARSASWELNLVALVDEEGVEPTGCLGHRSRLAEVLAWVRESQDDGFNVRWDVATLTQPSQHPLAPRGAVMLGNLFPACVLQEDRQLPALAIDRAVIAADQSGDLVEGVVIQ